MDSLVGRDGRAARLQPCVGRPKLLSVPSHARVFRSSVRSRGIHRARPMGDGESGARLQHRVHCIVRERRNRDVPPREAPDGAPRHRDPGGADVCVRRISRRPLRARAMAHDRVAAPEPLGASSLLLLRRVALPVRQRRRVSDAMSHGELFCILRAAAVGGGGDSRSVASAPAVVAHPGADDRSGRPCRGHTRADRPCVLSRAAGKRLPTHRH